MPRYRYSEFRTSCGSQRGDMLIEALISMLLFAIAGMGISYITSNVSVSQRELKVQQQVVNELRSRVQNRVDTTELCGGSTFDTENFTSTVTVSGCAVTTATVGATTINNVYAPVVLSATVEGLGEIRVGGTSSAN